MTRGYQVGLAAVSTAALIATGGVWFILQAGNIGPFQPSVVTGIFDIIQNILLQKGHPNIAQPTPPATDVAFSKWMSDYADKIGNAIKNADPNTRGLLFTSTSFPAAGRLLRQSDNGDVRMCSGVLVGARHFLTAAHCLCEKADSYFTSAKACLAGAQPTRLKTYVYLPAAWLYETDGSPKLYPDFNRVDKAVALRDKGQLGDLAIVGLKEASTIRPLAVAATEPIDHSISIGFGLTSVKSEDAAKFGLPVGVYAGGVGTIAFRNTLDCGAGYPDVICGHYTAFLPGPAGINTAACPGDSGGPLLGITSTGQAIVVGVASSRDSNAPGCDPTSEALTMYTTTAPHQDWINSAVSSQSAGSATVRCLEALVSPDDASTPVPIEIPAWSDRETVVSITAAGIDDNPAPAVDVKDSETMCNSILNQRDLQQCRIKAPQILRGSVHGRGVVQISACEIQ